MNRFTVAAVLLCTLIPSTHLFAQRPPTHKITVRGATLRTAVESTDVKIKDFKVWSGLGTETWYGEPGQGGTRLDNGEGFIVDWAKGIVSAPPVGLERYEVAFHVDYHYQGNPGAYIVKYAYDPATGEGYVYLPGKGDPQYFFNVMMISRGVEGNWLRATSDWNQFARSLIERDK